jgi:hypothetical protein
VMHDYPDLPALGHELDRLELKSDSMLGLLAQLVASDPSARLAAILALLGAGSAVIDAPAAAAADTVLDASGTVGAIVSFTDPGPEADVSFGLPTAYYHIGRVTYGTEAGWYAPQELRVNPLIIGPWGPDITRVQVAMYGGTATVSFIRRPLG